MSDTFDLIFEHYAKRLDAVDYVDYQNLAENQNVQTSTEENMFEKESADILADDNE